MMSEKCQVSEGYKKTEFGMIPQEWNFLKINDFCDVRTGGTPSTQNKDFWDGDIPWMSSGEINKKFVYDTEKKITQKGVENSNARILPDDSVMMALNGQGKTRGSVAVLKIPSTCNQSLACMIPNQKIAHYLYLYYNLQSRYLEIRNYTGNTGREGLNLKIIKDIKIPLPTFSEQQKIASILSKVDEQIEQTEQIIEKTELLKKGLMQKLLTKGIGHTKFKKTELGEIPEEWEIKRLTKVFNIIDYRGRTPPFSENGMPYIGADNVKDGRIVFSKRRYVSEETYTKYMTRGIPNPDDILFTTEAPLGNVAQVPRYKFCFAQRVVVFQCKNNLNPIFFMYLLKSKTMQKQFLNWATGTTVTGISSKNMRFIKLYYPKSIREQEKIGLTLKSVDKYIDSEKEKLLSLQELKKGLMQDLLTGKVRVTV
jgi:type I restriction enzyme, S subunit